MITFETQEDFAAAVLSAVERYLQIKVNIDYSSETDYRHANTEVSVWLRSNLSKTTFSEDNHRANHI